MTLRRSTLSRAREAHRQLLDDEYKRAGFRIQEYRLKPRIRRRRSRGHIWLPAHPPFEVMAGHKDHAPRFPCPYDFCAAGRIYDEVVLLGTLQFIPHSEYRAIRGGLERDFRAAMG